MIPDRLPLARRLRRAFWPVSIDGEIAGELDAHIELQTRRYMENGMTETDARDAARRRFGNLDQWRDECREIRDNMETDMRRAELLQELRMDAAYALRTLLRSPLFTLIAVVTIALGVAANTAIFGVVNAVLLRSLPYRNADRTMVVWNNNSQGSVSITAVAAPEYFDLKEQLRRFDAVAAITRQPSSIVGDGGEPERIIAYGVTPNMFDLLGARPLVGRAFGGFDGASDAPRVIVLSHALWMRRFGGDPKVIGRSVTVAGFPRTIIGVMPQAVRFPDAPLDFLREQADVWIPSTFESARAGSRGNQNLAVIARRSVGATPQQAAADIAAMSAKFRATFPQRYASAAAKGWSLIAIPLQDQMVGSVRTSLLVITVAVALVMLIACVNVANLLLARGAARQREIAVRMALGAARGRLIRQLLTESVVLTAAGGLVGVALAWAGMRLIVQLDTGEIPRLAGATIDVTVLVFSLGLTLAAGLLIGIVPALQLSPSNTRGALASNTRGASSGREANRLRRALVSAQVAMALLVLVGAGLLGRSFLALQQVKPGFSSSNVVSLQVTLPRSTYATADQILAFFDQLRGATAAIPGVAEASAVYPLPMSGDGWSGSFNVEGEPSGPDDPLPHAEYAATMPGYFHSLEIPMLAGRDFAATDDQHSPAVVIVDVSLAKQHWPRESAIGKRIGSPGQWATIVGVVGHVHNAGPRTDGEPQIYQPLPQNWQPTLSIVARTTAPLATLAAPMRAMVKQLDPELPIARLRSLADLEAERVAPQRFNMLLVALFGLTALALASIGLYGVMAFLVSQRTREIGIRVALGGEPGAIRSMVLREGIVICVGGLVAGVGIALVTTRALRGLLFGVGPNDPVTYAGIAILLLIVGGLASYGPARRATRVDPLVALRE